MRKLGVLLLFGFVFLLSGCVVRTYEATKDRLDQDLNAGNRGYLMGQAPAETGERKTTREIRVVEVELRPLFKFEKGKKVSVQSGQSLAEDDIGMEENIPSEAVSQNFTTYTVVKGDTLQKISQKYFGTTRNWMKIYEANKGVLKGPDKIRPGQVLNIPQLGNEPLKEPAENLK